MAYPRCPKCGFVAEIDDECPRCGVYISKFLAMRERIAVGGGRVPTVPPPADDRAVAVPAAVAAATETGRWGTTATVVWVLVALGFAAIGYVVLTDWFGAAFAYKPPLGWREAEDDAVERAVEGMCSRAREQTTLHTYYSPASDPLGQAAIVVLESANALPINEQTAEATRAMFDRLKGQPMLEGVTIGRPEILRLGGRPAIQIRVDLRMQALSAALLETTIGAERSTFIVIFFAPAETFRRELDEVRRSLDSFRVLRREGWLGGPAVKHGLRWTWAFGLLVACAVFVRRVRNRA